MAVYGKKRGRKKLPPEEKRETQVKARFNEAELEQLDKNRPKGTPRGEWLRHLALSRKLPRQIPQVNQEAWQDLARALANLNQLAKGLNESGMIEQVRALVEIRELRNKLIGVIDDT